MSTSNPIAISSYARVDIVLFVTVFGGSSTPQLQATGNFLQFRCRKERSDIRLQAETSFLLEIMESPSLNKLSKAVDTRKAVSGGEILVQSQFERERERTRFAHSRGGEKAFHT